MIHAKKNTVNFIIFPIFPLGLSLTDCDSTAAQADTAGPRLDHDMPRRVAPPQSAS